MKIRVTSCRTPTERISSIKMVRSVSTPNWGLKESKDAVYNLIDRGMAFEVETSLEKTSVLWEEFDSRFAYESVPTNHHEDAMRHLTEYAKELLTDGNFEAATNVSNLLSILKKVNEEVAGIK